MRKNDHPTKLNSMQKITKLPKKQSFAENSILEPSQENVSEEEILSEMELYTDVDPILKLELRSLNIRFQLPGLFDVLVPLSSQKEPMKFLNELYKTLKGQYWIILRVDQNKCLICQRIFKYRPCLMAHLNRHLGFFVASCSLCSKKFYSIQCGRAHIVRCAAKTSRIDMN